MVNGWIPIHALDIWQEDIGLPIICSICIPLLEGNQGNSILIIKDDRHYLTIKCSQPKELCDVRGQMHKWSAEKLSKYHPLIKLFEAFFTNIPLKNNNLLTSSYDTPLPFKVQKDIQLMEQYGGSDGSAILYVDAVSDEQDTYHNKHKQEKFKLVDSWLITCE